MASRADVMGWQEYVTLELERFAEHTAGNGRVWADTARAARKLAARRAGSPEEYAFTGPWHTVRPYVTLEFRQWVEEYEATERLTLSEWIERDRRERAAVDYLDSAAHSLDRLEEIRRGILERDAVIVEAAKRGASKTDIARASGLSRQQVHTIVRDALERDALEGAADTLAPVTPISAASGAHAAGEAVDTVRYETVNGAPVELHLIEGEWIEVF